MDAADDLGRLRHNISQLRLLIDAGHKFGVHRRDALLHAYATLLYEQTRRLIELERDVGAGTSASARMEHLVCVECGATSTDGHRWRAELAPDHVGGDELEVPVYCPPCWQQEFGAEQ